VSYSNAQWKENGCLLNGPAGEKQPSRIEVDFGSGPKYAAGARILIAPGSHVRQLPVLWPHENDPIRNVALAGMQ
jgi:pyruvate/2-oxoglutarate dehydrogenase complex dihydrolipoamide dehydrogenase (E3) component